MNRRSFLRSVGLAVAAPIACCLASPEFTIKDYGVVPRKYNIFGKDEVHMARLFSIRHNSSGWMTSTSFIEEQMKAVGDKDAYMNREIEMIKRSLRAAKFPNRGTTHGSI